MNFLITAGDIDEYCRFYFTHRILAHLFKVFLIGGIIPCGSFAFNDFPERAFS